MDENKVVEMNENEVEEAAGGRRSRRGRYVPQYYTVVYGDTLSEIAWDFGTTVPALMRLNPIIKNPDMIKVGWVLQIY